MAAFAVSDGVVRQMGPDCTVNRSFWRLAVASPFQKAVWMRFSWTVLSCAGSFIVLF